MATTGGWQATSHRLVVGAPTPRAWSGFGALLKWSDDNALMVFDLKTAKALGVTFSPELLAIADEVIE